jgi:MinD superfamily P-loop ATPase
MELAVISGKGGTGKSSITAAITALLKNVVLADCDVDAANMYLLFSPINTEVKTFKGAEKAVIDYNSCTNCSKCMLYCRFDAISKPAGKITISEVFCDGCGLCEKICPVNAIKMIPSENSNMISGDFRFGKMVYGRLAPGEENSGKLVNMVRDKAKEIAKSNNIEHIIIDGPPGIGCPVISTVTGVDYALIVTEPSLSGMHDLKRTIELVSNFNFNYGVLINKCDLNYELTQKISDYCSTREINIVGKIKFDSAFVESMVECKSIVEHSPENNVVLELKKILEKIITN